MKDKSWRGQTHARSHASSGEPAVTSRRAQRALAGRLLSYLLKIFDGIDGNSCDQTTNSAAGGDRDSYRAVGAQDKPGGLQRE